MSKLKNKKRTKAKSLQVVFATDGMKGFFERGKVLAKLADAGKPIPRKHIINFESAEELLAILTKARRELMALLRKGDASVTEITHTLHRDRAAVAKDIKLLEQYGLVKVNKETNPGHGHHTIVHAISKRPIQLTAVI